MSLARNVNGRIYVFSPVFVSLPVSGLRSRIHGCSCYQHGSSVFLTVNAAASRFQFCVSALASGYSCYPIFSSARALASEARRSLFAWYHGHFMSAKNAFERFRRSRSNQWKWIDSRRSDQRRQMHRGSPQPQCMFLGYMSPDFCLERRASQLTAQIHHTSSSAFMTRP